MLKGRSVGKPFGAAVIALLMTVGSAAAAGKAPRPENRSPNLALREIAQGLASMLGDVQVRRTLKEQVGKKFDGDFDVLYRDLANGPAGSGQTFREALGSAVGKVRKSEGRLTGGRAVLGDLDNLASALPRLQISIPVGFESWNAEESALLVAFVPMDVADEDLVEVEAFDVAGRRHLLDVLTAPDFPVVVVGLNERTDRNGYLIPELARPALDGRAAEKLARNAWNASGAAAEATPITHRFTPKIGCTGSSHAYGDQEFLNEIKINNDHEPWTSGSPEIYATYSFPDNQGIKGQYFMSNVDNEGQWYSISGPLFYWQSYYGNTIAMGVMEQDGSDFGTLALQLFRTELHAEHPQRRRFPRRHRRQFSRPHLRLLQHRVTRTSKWHSRVPEGLAESPLAWRTRVPTSATSRARGARERNPTTSRTTATATPAAPGTARASAERSTAR